MLIYCSNGKIKCKAATDNHPDSGIQQIDKEKSHTQCEIILRVDGDGYILL